MSARVDLYTWSLDGQDNEALSPLLTDEERTRAARYVDPRDGAHFIAARGMVRKILARAIGAAPETLTFSLGEHGKPSLTCAGAPHFNFTDSGTFGALAISRDCVVGVDIERVREREFSKLAERYFAPDEAAAYAALPAEQKREVFFRIWTRKEAFLKAVGTGLATKLSAFEVSLNEEARLTRVDAAIDADVSAWVMHAFTPAPGYLGAIAARTGGAALDVRVCAL